MEPQSEVAGIMLAGRQIYKSHTYILILFLSALADSSVEACLRDLGFGYRARFLQQSAKQILDNHSLQWLESLRSVPYLQARDALRTLPGVGTKVRQGNIL